MSSTSTWNDLERRISAAVKLPQRPVAIAFLDTAPSGVEKFSATQPSGCGFWRLAAEGRVFYTLPEDPSLLPHETSFSPVVPLLTWLLS